MNPTIDTECGETHRRNIKVIVAYDGTGFSGWQRQADNQKTVQEEIEKALSKIHKVPVPVTGSGRTDAGVHAAGQTANFFTTIKKMEASCFVPALNNILSRDIRILEAEEVPLGFNARYDAVSRTYRYFFLPGRAGFPWELKNAWQLWHRPSLLLLNDLAAQLSGEIDCTIFASSSDKSVSRSRYIHGASFFIEGEKLVFEITANAFLHKMVRYIAGTLIRFEEEKISPSTFKEIIDSKNRSLAGPTAPPNGLFLWKVNYDRRVGVG